VFYKFRAFSTLSIPQRSQFYPSHQVLELVIGNTKISVAPATVRSSITLAMLSFSTIELIATQVGSSSAVIVGARLPGVMAVAPSRKERSMLYWQRTYFCAPFQCVSKVHGVWRGDMGKDMVKVLITPLIRLAIMSTSF